MHYGQRLAAADDFQEALFLEPWRVATWARLAAATGANAAAAAAGVKPFLCIPSCLLDCDTHNVCAGCWLDDDTPPY